MTARDRRLAASALLLIALAAPRASASEGGLVLVPDPPTLGLLVALFALLVPLVNRLLLTPVLRALEARAERTEGARRRAARLEEQVREIVARFEGSLHDVRQTAEGSRREILDAARRDATARLGEARSQAESELGRVRHEVGSALGDARQGLRAQAEELAREAAARVLGRSLA